MADNDYDYDENDEPAEDEPAEDKADESDEPADPAVAAKARNEARLDGELGGREGQRLFRD